MKGRQKMEENTNRTQKKSDVNRKKITKNTSNSSLSARKKQSRAKAKRAKKRRQILAFSALFSVLFLVSITVFAVKKSRHIEITLRAVSGSVLQGEVIPEYRAEAVCTQPKKEKRFLDRKSDYRVSDLLEDLNSGKGYTIKCNANNIDEGAYKIRVKLTDELQKQLDEEWKRVSIVVKNGKFTVKNKTGQWDGETKFKRWDGTYVTSDFVESNGATYYFDNEGNLVTGEYQIGYAKCVFDEDGKLKSKETSIDPNKPMMALTFDDGPGEQTVRLLEVLNKYNAHATFFMLGEKVTGNEETIRKMTKIGCELGTHSFDHSSLSTLDAEGVKDQMNKSSNLIHAAGGKSVTVMRPPYGDYAGETANNVGYPIILWNIDTLDWESRDKDQIILNVKTYADDGDIVLMHDIYESTIDAAIELIPYLVGEGYQLVTISELAEARGITLGNGVAYTDFNR